ncbi:MAG: TonB-dependent siderophore receptor [Leptolyngbyaceae cyanobacterium SU_3_3]|nr:TonB-dependent siderophore receptor [Leptolyngbyaceae cyanobacterium SU_3_3]
MSLQWSGSVRLGFLVMLVGGCVSGVALPGGAQSVETKSIDNLTRIRDRRPATTVQEWMAQVEAAQVQVTNVKLEPTATGLDIVLETAEGKPLQVDATKFRREGNSLIADIPNAVLALPQGQPFVTDNPTADIATVQVVQQDAGNIRVSVAGNNALPKTEVTLKTGGLTYSLNPVADEPDEEIEIVVTGERQQDGYQVPNASTATKTDTPLRDIPASIQVVPRQVLEDRNVTRLNEALETVSGVSGPFVRSGITSGGRVIRGFEQIGNFRNGFSQGNEFDGLDPIGTIERVEVLKGPASVLFGAIETGGIVNTVTRQPLSEPYYRLEFQAGNRNFYQPIIDFSGPLTTDKKVLYRLIAGYETQDGFKEFTGSEQYSIAPSITINFSKQTSLKLYYEFNRATLDAGAFFSDVIRPDGSFITPRNLFTSYLNTDNASFETQRVGYTFNHSFSDNWQIRNSLAIELSRYRLNGTFFDGIRDERFLTFSNGFSQNSLIRLDNYFGQIDLLGRFNTGSISHQVLVGFDVNDFNVNDDTSFLDVSGLPDLDIFNPNYDVPGTPILRFNNFNRASRSYGLYLQDQIAFSDNLKLLIGGRYDWVSDEIQRTGFEGSSLNDGAFSPRIGLVYQPSDTVSLYASYSRSFRPFTFGFAADGSRNFEPTVGTQYEVGVKADFLDGRLSTTLAAYHLTKTNVITPNPDPVLAAQGFSIQTGEQRSQGIELDIAGEILPGWKVIGSYTYTDAEVTKDNSTPVGNRLANVPENQVSLWTTYEIQRGDLKGLGLGLFYVGERRADLANETILRDYLRTDASLFYRRGGFRAALNVRNLFDINYVEQSFGTLSATRGKPFTIVGSLSWEF